MASDFQVVLVFHVQRRAAYAKKYWPVINVQVLAKSIKYKIGHATSELALDLLITY